MSERFSDWEKVHCNPWFCLYRKDGWHVLGATGGRSGAATLIIDKHDNVLLLENFRIAVDEVCLEIPRGGAEAGESHAPCALREAREETGLDLKIDDLIPLGSVWPDTGIMSSQVRLFAARLDFAFDKIEIDQTESRGYRIVPIPSLRAMIDSGEISDAFTIAACARYFGLADARRHGAPRDIEILDEGGVVMAEIHTSDPDWSFEQYCRNRSTVGWRWRFA